MTCTVAILLTVVVLVGAAMGARHVVQSAGAWVASWSTERPTPTPSGSLASSEIVSGAIVQVVETGTQESLYRMTPSGNSYDWSWIRFAPAGSQFPLTGNTIDRHGEQWREVQAGAVTAWIRSANVEVMSAEATPPRP